MIAYQRNPGKSLDPGEFTHRGKKSPPESLRYPVGRAYSGRYGIGVYPPPGR